MDLATFERERVALFARNGFEGKSRWLTDREGRRTYAIGRGEGRCPTMLVHGGLSQASEWSLMAGLLPGNVIIPDRPGCGLSYAIDYRRVDFRQAAADWTLDLIDGIGAEQIDLVGASMGGYFSIAFALAYPDRVRRLILVGAPPGLERKFRGPFFMRLMGNPIAGPLIGKMKITDAEKDRKVFSNLVAHPEALPLGVLETDMAAMAIPGVGRAAYTMMRAMTTLLGFRPDVVIGDDLAHLAVPTLFLWGDADALLPPAVGEKVAAGMPDATFEVIPDAGHVLQLDQPDTVAAAITEFLAHADTT
jgi:2-hydroxy-6-oxonona-2,4-dienedioate hydrolase